MTRSKGEVLWPTYNRKSRRVLPIPADTLQYLTDSWSLTPYANEIDTTRAAACREKLGDERAVQGDIMTLRTPNRAYSVVFVNPPYAENSGHADEKRREFEMLAHAQADRRGKHLQ